MKTLMLAVVTGLVVTACASNRSGDEPGARIRDTTITAADTTKMTDSLPHIRDSVPDSTQAR
jgi:hypothetical protein